MTTTLDWRTLTVEPTGAKTHGPCDCCGRVTRTVWGFVHEPGGATRASYFVSWHPESPAHDAYFDFILGRWGDGTSAADRRAAAMAYRASAGSFMVVDAAVRPVGTSDLSAAALRADEVVGQPIAGELYAVADAVFVKDERIEEIRCWAGPAAT